MMTADDARLYREIDEALARMDRREEIGARQRRKNREAWLAEVNSQRAQESSARGAG